VPKLPLTVLDSLPTLHVSWWVKNKKTLAPAEVVRVRVRIEENEWIIGLQSCSAPTGTDQVLEWMSSSFDSYSFSGTCSTNIVW